MLSENEERISDLRYKVSTIYKKDTNKLDGMDISNYFEKSYELICLLSKQIQQLKQENKRYKIHYNKLKYEYENINNRYLRLLEE